MLDTTYLLQEKKTIYLCILLKNHLISFKNTKNHSSSSKSNKPIKLLSKIM